MARTDSSSKPRTWAQNIGLVLPGGGARCAYQVGVLKGLAELMPRRAPNPFRVISGTSAGAINAVVLATRARLLRHGVADLERVWGNFRTEQVFRCDTGTMVKSSLHWLAALVLGGLGVRNPRSLLDNEPLEQLLARNIRFDAVGNAIDKGYLDALAVTAASYDSARSITFFKGCEGLESWARVRRCGKPAELGLPHLMASVAAPLVFPPVQIGNEYFGDGAMRQPTPLSPAVRLGAERLLIIGCRDEESATDPTIGDAGVFPSFGRIAGYMLDTLIMDGLASDLERLTRINLMLNQMPDRRMDGDGGPLSFIDALIILPSRDVRDVALRYMHELPRPVRLLMRGLGALNYGGRQLISYLLFEAGYTRALIELGYEDAMARREELTAFMDGVPLDSATGISGWQDLSDEYSQRLPALKEPATG